MSPRPRTPADALRADPSLVFVDAPDPRDEDIWDAWVFAAADASRALQQWHAADTDDRGAAFAAYGAALDREEQAAHVLARYAVSAQRA